MNTKPFSTIDEQIAILERRGVVCDEATPLALMREGYYAIVNGYKEPFLDAQATDAAGEDRYKPGTRFSELYKLFCKDRAVRARTFAYLMMVESMLRSVISYSFCEVHKATEAYLKPGCYTQAAHYLRGEERLGKDLEWMISTLDKYARGVEADEPEGGDGADVRVAYYRDVHGGVPLWVLFTELTFGNLKYFYALMKPEEQEAVCSRLAQLCKQDVPLKREELYERLELLVEARNACAHGERLMSARFGQQNQWGYQDLVETLAALLPEEDRRGYLKE